MNDSNTKRPLKWFEDRVGQFIYRAPFFQSEQGRPHIAMKIKDKAHALLLFDLQRAGRPPYEDKPGSFTMTSTRSR